MSAQIFTVSSAKLMAIISEVFAYVKPVSVITAQNVQRWWSALIVTPFIVLVALVITNALVLSVGEPFVILVACLIIASNATEAGVTIVIIP